jgi:ATP-dependent helicase/nuclease subunit B
MDLFSHSRPGTVILTPNRRLSAAFLKKQHAIELAQENKCWPTVDILEISKWIQRTWLQYSATKMEFLPLLLTPNQEQITWEEILSHSSESDYLLQVSSTAELARTAWGLLKQWLIKSDNSALTTTEDGQILQKWSQKFEAICSANNWLPAQSIADQVIEKIGNGEINPPAEIILIGFTELPPQQQHLLNTCEKSGSHIHHYKPEAIKNSQQRISLNNTETEIRTMARWAKINYENNQQATICCVVPNLEEIRERVIQLFSEVFFEENTYTLNHTTLPFNISAGKNLSLYPVIHTALQLLSLPINNIPINTISNLLHSPYVGEAEQEMLVRAELDSALRRDNMATLSLHDLIKHKVASHCPALLTRLQMYLNELPNKNEPLSIMQWVASFMNILTTLGWPGERSLDSHEYQTTKTWLDLLSDYTTYDRILGKLPYQKSLHYLKYLTAKVIFQPESPEARIQILGTLEAAELPFDYLWVMGLDDTAWPQAPKPNPFIPQRLQKTLHMPRANAERELIFAKHLTTQFKRNATTIIFSHALHKDDTELRPSPLITDLAEVKLEELILAPLQTPAENIFTHNDIEFIQDDIAPSILENETIYGGSNLLKKQAACPFKAFAELRLHARQLESPTLGLRPEDRGNIIHHTMEMIWSVLKDSHTLQNMESIALQNLIMNCIEKAMRKVTHFSYNNRRYLALEAERIQKLISDWLELEKKRPNFKVTSLEQELKTSLGNISLTLRADRIDELDNGKKIIIDYKTGKMSPSRDWFGERPNEPQLPLYCILDHSDATGILFAQINSEEMKWKGISENLLGIESVNTLQDEKNTAATTWVEQREKWKITLEQLGEDFYTGKAHVDPKDTMLTCRYCQLQTLCRIHETIV